MTIEENAQSNGKQSDKDAKLLNFDFHRGILIAPHCALKVVIFEFVQRIRFKNAKHLNCIGKP